MVGAVQQSSAGMEQQEALWKMVEKAVNETNMEDKEQLFTLLLEYQDLFARSSDDFGCTGKLKHAMDTEGCKSVCQCTRRMSPTEKEEASKVLREILDRNVIQPSNSPWASPVILVEKKGGSTWFCVDYR